MCFRNKTAGVFLTYKVPSSGGKLDPNMTALFQKGCQRQFILLKLIVTDKDTEYRLPSSDTNSELCKVCTCCSNHFKQHKCAAVTENDLIFKILQLE